MARGGASRSESTSTAATSRARLPRRSRRGDATGADDSDVRRRGYGPASDTMTVDTKCRSEATTRSSPTKAQ